MVNSGTFTSTENQNGIECLEARGESSSTTPVSYKNNVEAKNDDILPCQTASAIEPTIDCDKSNISKMDQEEEQQDDDDDDDDDKRHRYQQSRFFCSVPLDKVQTVLSTYNASTTRTSSTAKTAETSPSSAPASSIKVKTVQRKVLCLFCDRTFVSDTLRQKHVERCHSPKQFRRVSLRKHQNHFTSTPCVYCDKLASTNHTLPELFLHLIEKHSNKYFGCLVCNDRFLNRQQLAEHNNKIHNIPITESISVDKQQQQKGSAAVEEKIVKQQDHSQIEHQRNDAEENSESNKKKKIVRNGKKLKNSKVIVKRSKRLQAKVLSEPETATKPKNRKGKNIEHNKLNNETQSVSTMPVLSSSTTTALASNTVVHGAASTPKQNNDKPSKTNSVNPYPEFDSFFQVKKITDHSIDNLKISSLTFDDVFDKAFFNRIQCNIQENLLNHIDGKLFKNEESESRISNFEKISTLHQTDATQNLSSENYGCELSLNAVTPTTSSLLSTQQFGEDPESQIEYGSKPSKKKALIKKDEVHYKYFTRRKYQAIILEQKENRDLSKLDMWTQLVIKNRQQKIVDDKKSAKEILDYFSGAEYKNKMQREELNRILDRRGPFEDLREEVSKKAALDKLNVHSEEIDVQEEVCELLNDLLNNVFEMIEESSVITCTTPSTNDEEEEEEEQTCEIPSYLNLRRATASVTAHDGEIDKSDKIALICSSQETENFELPTNTVRRKNEKVELTGEWARSRIYVCAACGLKLQNMKQFLEHKSNAHQYVWVQHYEFVGNQSELYSHLSIPVLGKVGVLEENLPAGKMWRRSEARQCTKCAKQCNSLGELHRHILECGGDWTWMLARKKCKYRPFGAKSRRKRRGLVKRIYTQKTEPSEKKIYKKAVDGPRQKPSDAETIQRMLANLPPKRATRKLISLKDGFNTSRSNQQVKVKTQAKLKCGKLIHGEKNDKELMPAPPPPPPPPPQQPPAKEKPSAKKQQQKLNFRRSLRSLNKVLATRILETNSTLIIRRKYKTKLSEKAQKNNSNMESNKSDKQKKRMRITTTTTTSDSVKSTESGQRKRSSPRNERKTQSNNELVVSAKSVVKDKMNIKRFFPVKKKQAVVENEEKKRVKRKIANQLTSNEIKKLKQQEGKTEAETTDDKTIKTLRKRKTTVTVAAENKKPENSSRLRSRFRSVVNKIKKLNASEKEKSKDCPEEKKVLNNFLDEREKNIDENPPVLEPQVFILSSEVIAKQEQVLEIKTEAMDTPAAAPLLLSPSQQQKKKIRKPARGLNDCIAMLTNKLTMKTGEQDVGVVEQQPAPAPILNDTENNSKGYILKVPLFNEHFCLKQQTAACQENRNKEEEKVNVEQETIKTIESVKDCIWNCLIEKSDIKLRSPLNGDSCHLKLTKKKKKKVNKKLNQLIQSNIDDFLIPSGTTTETLAASNKKEEEEENKIQIENDVVMAKDDLDEDEFPLSIFLKDESNLKPPPSSPQLNNIDKVCSDNVVEEIIPDNDDNDVQNVRIEQKKIDGLLGNATGGNVDALVPSPKTADKCSNLDYFDKFPSTAIQDEPISDNAELIIENNKTVETTTTTTDVNNLSIFDFTDENNHENDNKLISNTDKEEETEECEISSEKPVIQNTEKDCNAVSLLEIEESASSSSCSKNNEGEIKENLNGKRKTVRCAKSKSLENIHDEALSELTDSERNREYFNATTTTNTAVIENNFTKPPAATSTTPLKRNNRTTRKSLSKKEKSNEDLSIAADNNKINENENEIKSADEAAAAATALEINELNNSSSSVKELRRSGRNSRKIIYNEIDLVDPLIDELDSKMEKEIKNIQISSELVNLKTVDYHHHPSVILNNSEPKLNSDELFDLLKATPNENIVLSKPTNSFLKNFDDLSDDGMNVVFNNILDKTSDIEDDLIDKTFPSLIITNNDSFTAVLETSSDAKAKTPKTQKNKKKKTNSLKRKQAKLLGKEIETKLQNDSIPPPQVEQDKRNSIEDNSMELSSLDNKNFCEICNKSFRRLEGLIKHKRTLTHISKLSELEAKEAALKQQEQLQETAAAAVAAEEEETPSDLPLLNIFQNDTNKTPTPSATCSPVTPFTLAVENSSSLKLADIINDVLNKPTTTCEEENAEEIGAEAKRYRSLGERKSFEEEAKVIETPPPYFEPQISNTAQKQITLLESIIENRLVEYSNVDDVSCEKTQEIETKTTSSSSAVLHRTKINDDFVRPLQYEEISEDSNLKSFVDDQKARKVLNRDEELFLECCSLLKSGSEVSNFSKKSKQLKLFQQSASNDDCWPVNKCENDSNSAIAMALVNNFNEGEEEDGEECSNTISSNWNNNSQTEKDSTSDDVSFHSHNGTFSFDAFKRGAADIDDVQSNMFDETSYNSSRLSAECKPSGDLSDGSTDSKKMLTKGAMKVFEGLKVSIPTEELNLTKLLIPSSQSKQSTRKSEPLKRDNLHIKKNNRKSAAGLLVSSSKCHDVYDFEETQDNSDVFNKPDFKSFRLNVDCRKIESDDNEQSCDGMSSTSSSAPGDLFVAPNINKTQENITKKKCMIMGRIFKNAAKSKIDEDIRNIPILDNNKLVEEFVKSCPVPVNNPEPPQSPPPPKMTEEEMNVAFDKLVGNVAASESVQKSHNGKNKIISSTTTNANCNNKRKTNNANKAKAKKRNLDDSDVSSDDEFALKKSPKKRTKRKSTRPQDNSINLEQELKECIGVAGRKSQRKCTSGKQNVLIEYWSSDESLFETLLLENKQTTPVEEEEKEVVVEPTKIIEPQLEQQSLVIATALLVEKPKLDEGYVVPKKKSNIGSKGKGMSSSTSPRRKRAAANPLYHWSSSSEDESGDLIEVKPIRDEIDDDEDRPIQHGWIVGDSPKKLVTMLAQAKGKKCDIDGVKEQGKKRTNMFS